MIFKFKFSTNLHPFISSPFFKAIPITTLFAVSTILVVLNCCGKVFISSTSTDELLRVPKVVNPTVKPPNNLTASSKRFFNLSAIFEVINPLLKSNGLGFTQLVGENNIKTVIFHAESGEVIETTTNIPQNVVLKGMNDFQVLGSAITYIRRYALSSALGLITDKDIDAGGVQETKPASKQNLLVNSKEYKLVFDALKKGYKMDEVKAKYQLSNEVESQLLKELGA